ncbi:MAG: DUF721 domain-containing protein [Gemmatimonadetes bacterium]|nr:DUF721 domain-containing protein [Gemmatimonadota bacterium]
MTGSSSRPDQARQGSGGDPFAQVADVLQGYLDDTGLSDSLARLGAMDEWADVVGPRISGVTRPVEVRGETLVVEAASSAWISELTMMSRLILERLNTSREGPPIGRIRYRLAETTEILKQSSGR